jgi:hypothetical protein
MAPQPGLSQSGNDSQSGGEVEHLPNKQSGSKPLRLVETVFACLAWTIILIALIFIVLFRSGAG